MHNFRLSQCTSYLSSVRDVLPLYLRSIVKDCTSKDLSLIHDSYLYHTSISPKAISKGSFSIVSSSCHNLLKTISSFAKLYNFELKVTQFASAYARLLHEVVFENSQYSIKKRIDHYANYLFPDSELRLTGIRIMKGPLGHFFRDWARRLHKYGSKDERASVSMSLLKVCNAINRGDFMALSTHDKKYRESREPTRNPIAVDRLKQQIRKVVNYLYSPREFTEPSHIDAPFHNGSFEISRSEGGSHCALIKEREEYLYMGYHPRLGVSEEKVHPWWDDVGEYDEDYDAKICHIADKGKIRTITALSSHANYFIKRAQRYFFEPIWADRIFSYTCCDPQRESSCFEDMLGKSITLTDFDSWVSGDYEKCTDMFSKDWTKFVIKQICKRVFKNEDRPYFWRIMAGELESTVDLRLPFFYGQPQGHGLSFAILCVINLSIISYCYDTCNTHEYYYVKKGDPIVPFRCLPVKINGDDIVFASTPDIYDVWCKFCIALGLKVNQVKSYKSSTHFTLNSRAFTFDGEKCRNCVSFLPSQICQPPRGSLSLERLEYFYKNKEETISDYSSRCENFIRSDNEADYIRKLRLFLNLNPLRPGHKYKRRYLTKPPMPLFVSIDQGGLGLKIPTYVDIKSKILYKDVECTIRHPLGFDKRIFRKEVSGIKVEPRCSFLKINGEQRAHMQAYKLLIYNRHSDNLGDEQQASDLSSNLTRPGLGYHEERVINLDRDLLTCGTERKEDPPKEKSLKRWLDLTYMFRGPFHLMCEKDMSNMSELISLRKKYKSIGRNLRPERTVYAPLDWFTSIDGTVPLTTIDR